MPHPAHRWLLVAAALVASQVAAAATPEEDFQRGEALVRDKKPKEAAKAYGEFLAQNADHSLATEARYRLAQCQEELGMSEDAAASLVLVTAKADTRFKNRPAALLLLGKLQAANDKDHKAASATLEKLLGEGAGLYEDEVLGLLAAYAAADGKFDDAASRLNLLKRRENPKIAEAAAIKLAVLWVRAEKLDLAIAAIQEVAGTYPKNPAVPELLLRVADLARQQKKMDKVVAIAELLKSSHPGSEAALGGAYLVAMVQRERKDFAAAVKTLDQIGKLTQPRLRGIASEALAAAAEIYQNDLGDLPTAIQRYVDAIAVLREVETARKKDILERCHFNLGEHHFAKKNWGAALDHYVQLRALGTAINILPRILACQAALGDDKSNVTMSEVDLKALEQKAKDNPGTEIGLEATVRVLDIRLTNALQGHRQGYAKIVEGYAQVLKDFPKAVLDSNWNGIHCLSQQGVALMQSPIKADLTKAIEAFEQAVAADPTTRNPYQVTSLESIAQIADRTGDSERSRKAYAELFQIFKGRLDKGGATKEDEKRTLQYLGADLTRRTGADSIQQAIDTTQKLIAEKGALSDLARGARFYLGELHYLKKDFSNAARAYREFIQSYGPKQGADGNFANGPWDPGQVDEPTQQIFDAAARIAQAWYLGRHDQNMIAAYAWMAKNLPNKNKYMPEAQYWLAMELGKGDKGASKEGRRAMAEALWRKVVSDSLEPTQFKKMRRPWVENARNDPDTAKYVKSAMIKAGQVFSERQEHEIAAAMFATYLDVFPPPNNEERRRTKDAAQPVKTDETAPIARYALGLEYVALGDSTKLINAYKPYINGLWDDRFRVSALKQLGFHAGRSESYDDAVDAYATLLDEYGDNKTDAQGQPIPLAKNERLRRGNTQWDGIRLPAPKDLDQGEVRFMLGYLYWTHDNYAACAQALAPFLVDEKLQAGKSGDRALFMAGQSWLRIRDHANGVRALRLLIDQYPRFEGVEEAYTHTARGYVELKNWPEFDALYTRFLQAFPASDRRPRMDLCNALATVGKGKAEAGMNALRQLADSDTHEDVKADAGYHLGIVLANQKPPNHAEAFTVLEKSVLTYPREAACLEAGRCAMKLGKWDQARGHLERAIQEFPKGNPDTISQAKSLLQTVQKELVKPNKK